MDPVRNPYSPGAGRPPAALVGRQRQIDTWQVALDRITVGRDAQSVVLYGLRGVGKTVLLSRFESAARKAGWLVAKVEARSGGSVREEIGEAFREPLHELARPGVGTRVLRALKTALSFKASYDSSGNWNFGLDLSEAAGGGAGTGSFESDLGTLLRDLCGAAEAYGTGVALLIDEAQDLSLEEMLSLCAIIHAANQRSERLLVGLAGLPSLPKKLAEAKSYAERLFAYHPVVALEQKDARTALEEPAHKEDASWDADAVDYVVAEAGGYPYFLQQYGQETWAVAHESPLSLQSARLGVAQGRAALDTGFFRSRWDRATRAEREYLRAMAQDGDSGSSSSEVAARLGREPSALGPARNKLIRKGLIYSPEHGVVAYTVPGMADFVLRQPG